MDRRLYIWYAGLILIVDREYDAVTCDDHDDEEKDDDDDGEDYDDAYDDNNDDDDRNDDDLTIGKRSNHCGCEGSSRKCCQVKAMIESGDI